MALKATVGARFSELVDNLEPSRYTPREYVSWHGFECYGHLPDGSRFGVGKLRDVDECWYDDFFLIDADGRALAYAYEHFRSVGMPEAAVLPAGVREVGLVTQGVFFCNQDSKTGAVGGLDSVSFISQIEVSRDDCRRGGVHNEQGVWAREQ